METYRQFLDRINSFELPCTYYGEGYIQMNPNLSGKVEEDNRFKAFYGDTTVFDLDKDVKEKVNEIVDSIYKTVPECFAERLISHTFHMTLHDLSNSPILHSIAEEMFYNELKILNICGEIRKNMKIRMKTKYIFNMVSNSLVLGLYPADGQEYDKLMELYGVINKVKTLDYPLTCHITLAYYNVHGFQTESARKLEQLIKSWNEKICDMEIELNTSNLYYQKFVNMNQYINVIKLG